MNHRAKSHESKHIDIKEGYEGGLRLLAIYEGTDDIKYRSQGGRHVSGVSRKSGQR